MDRKSASFIWVFLLIATSAHADEISEAFFETKIRPVLATDCLPCHGGKKTESGLKVDSRASLLQGGDRGPAIEAGKPDQSLLVRAIRYADDDLKMPPKRRLTAGVATDFAQWVAQGAVWPEPKGQQRTDARPRNYRHWAFQQIKGPQPPDVPTQSNRAIDRFIEARRTSAGLHPVRLADRRTLIRRATFDLIGMPPTPQEVADFVNDRSPDAFSHVVDRLLASPHYGERWGRHWMDVVRYADTAGDNADYPIPEVFRYRDYIIKSFNQDKPFDQFIREQLAGDVLASAERSPAMPIRSLPQDSWPLPGDMRRRRSSFGT